MNAEAERCLDQVAILASLSRDEKRALASELRAQPLAPHEQLFEAGDPAGSVYFVARGELEILGVDTGDESRRRINLVGPGAVIGELAVLRQEHRSAGVRAHTEALVYALDGACFTRLIRSWPEVALAIARAAADHVVRVEQRARAVRAPVWLLAADDELPPSFMVALIQAAVSQLGRPARRRCGAGARPPRGARTARVARGPDRLRRRDQHRCGRRWWLCGRRIVAPTRSHPGERQVFAADLAITPTTDSISFVEFCKGPELFECGRRATAAMTEQVQGLARVP